MAKQNTTRIKNAIATAVKEFAKADAEADRNGGGWELGEHPASEDYEAAMERRDGILRLLRELGEKLAEMEKSS